MKLPVFTAELRATKRRLGIGVVVLAVWFAGSASFLAAQNPRSASSGKTKASDALLAKPSPPKVEPMSKEIPIPLPVGDTALGLKVPDVGVAGQLLSQLFAAKAKRIDDNHLELQGTKIDLNQADGKSDYHIEIPTSVFDLKTRIITSDQAVVIRTQDFELTGEKMRFDTVEKSGELIGKVRMVIHNLKQTAGIVPQPLPKSE